MISMEKEPDLSHLELLTILEKVRYSARQETKLEVAECMLDYGIDITLVGAVTGLKKSQLLSGK